VLTGDTQASAAFQEALARHQRGELSAAERIYRQVLADEPADYGALFCLGVLCANTGRLDEGVGLLSEAARVNPEGAEAHACLADALAALGRPAEAVRAYEEAIRLRPAYFEALNNLGNLLQAGGRDIEAAGCYRRAVAAKPDYAPAYNNLGLSLQRLGQLDQAVSHFRAALAIDPAYAAPHVNLGNALRVLGRAQDAVAQYERALAIEPGSPDAHNGLGAALEALGRPAEAVEHLRAALAVRPAYAEAHNNLANSLRSLRRHHEALDEYEAALALQPDNAGTLANLGTLLHAMGEFDRAEARYEAALALDDTNKQAHQGLAVLLLGRGETATAVAHGRRGFDVGVTAYGYSGGGEPIRVLTLSSVLGRNILADRWIDEQTFLKYDLLVDFIDGPVEVPDVHLVVNTIADADLCSLALTNAVKLLRLRGLPVVNPPERVLRTGRVETAERLAHLPGVRTPRTAAFPRESLDGQTLAAAGFEWPLLLRTPGFHTGLHFRKVERAEDLAAALAELPGKEVLAIEFLDTRGADGLFRKFRALIAGEGLYPLHLAITEQWMAHRYTAEIMAERPRLRGEESAFLHDMPRFLGPDVMAALEAVRQTLGLDYAAMDFGLMPDGQVALFEANAAVNIPPPPPEPLWDYRREPMNRAVEAVGRMLLERAAAPISI